MGFSEILQQSPKHRQRQSALLTESESQSKGEQSMRIFRHGIVLASVLGAGVAGAAAAGDHGMFIIHSLDQPAELAAAQVRAHTEADDDWQFLAEFGLAGGSVTALKIC